MRTNYQNLKLPSGTKIVCQCEDCPRFHHEMDVKDETFSHWVFRCRTCENLRTVDKFRVGGTIGAGRREDQPALKYIGKGF